MCRMHYETQKHVKFLEPGVRFVHHEHDYRPNWTTRSLITN